MVRLFLAPRPVKIKDVNFNLDMVVRPDNYSIAGLKAITPPHWRAGIPARDLANMKLLRKFDGELGNKTAWEMLTELEKGYQPTFYYQDWQNSADKIAVGLSSVNFKQAYWAFLQCRDAMLPYSFEDISFTVMNYEPNSSNLTKTSQKRLEKIAEYLKYDTVLPLYQSRLTPIVTAAAGITSNYPKKRAQKRLKTI